MEHPDLQLPNIPSGKGERSIVLNAGSDKTGFIPNCKLVFRGKEVDGDYHKEMTSTIFLDWFTNTLFENIIPNCVIVLENASYHKIKSECYKTPTSATRKADMQAWLEEKDIAFDKKLLKPALYDLIKAN